MVISNLECSILDFCDYYEIIAEKLTFGHDGKVPVLEIAGTKKPVLGLRNIVNLASTTKPYSSIHAALHDQWAEYGGTHAAYSNLPANTPHILKELNTFLSSKVYFVGNQQGPIDVLMYCLLHQAVCSLTFSDKEKYLHVCRWFNTIQQDSKARGQKNLVCFSRTRLYI